MRFTWIGIILAAIGVWFLVAQSSVILGVIFLVLAFTVGGLDLFKGRRRVT